MSEFDDFMDSLMRTMPSLSGIAAGYLYPAGYASKYEADTYTLLSAINTIVDLKISFQQIDSALIQTGINPDVLYYDFSSGKETERIVALTEALGLPQHALIGRGVKITGKVVEADEQAIRWLLEGE